MVNSVWARVCRMLCAEGGFVRRPKSSRASLCRRIGLVDGAEVDYVREDSIWLRPTVVTEVLSVGGGFRFAG